MARPSVSAVVACYLDQQAIPDMYRRLSQVFSLLDCEYEIIFVNDCSPDESESEIRKLSADDPRVLGINHSRNFGSQFAFQSGMRLSSMDCVVLLDGDLQDPPEVISAMYEKFMEGFDVVYGERTMREMGRFKHSFYRLFYFIYSQLADFRIPRNVGDFSMLSRRVVDALLQFRERDLFLRSLRAYAGFRQVGVPYFRPERPYGSSTNSFARNLAWARKAFFSSTQKPLRFLTNVGFVVFFASLTLGSALVVQRLFWPQASVPGITLLAVLTIGLGGANFFGLGLIGEYLGKVLDEVKQRPAPIVVSFIRNGRVTFGTSEED